MARGGVARHCWQRRTLREDCWCFPRSICWNAEPARSQVRTFVTSQVESLSVEAKTAAHWRQVQEEDDEREAKRAAGCKLQQQFAPVAQSAHGFFFGFASLCGLHVVHVLYGATMCCPSGPRSPSTAGAFSASAEAASKASLSLSSSLDHKTAPACSRVDDLTGASPLPIVVSAPSAPSVFPTSLSATLSAAGVCAAAGGWWLVVCWVRCLGGWQVGVLVLALCHLQHLRMFGALHRAVLIRVTTRSN